MSTSVNVKIEQSRKDILQDEFRTPYFQKIIDTLHAEKKQGKTVYPPGSLIFNAFNTTPFDKVKVVILGQDPYHGDGQAHGLSFSVPDGVRQPPSLKNIFKELHQDVLIDIPTSGNLTKRATQGVFLLNALLTVRAGEPTAHKNIGRQQFTDVVIQKISDKKTGVIFLLRGAFAQSKKQLIDTNKHYILTAPHPSPFSADRGFFGCKHFSQTNDLLQKQGKEPIDRSVK